MAVKTRRCARCTRRFTYVRSTKRFCSARCEDAARKQAKRAQQRADPIHVAQMKVATWKQCALCPEWFVAQARTRKERLYCGITCKRIAEKLVDL